MRINLSRQGGFCLLDPHGSLYQAMVDYLAVKRPDLASRVILVDPSSSVHPVVGFNPFPENSEYLDFTVSTLVEGCLKAWGQTDPKSTPRIARWLENIFHVIAVNKLTLLETAHLVRTENSAERDTLLAAIENDLVRDDWMMFQKARPREREAYMEGAANRLRAFVQSAAIRNMIGQDSKGLNFSKIIEEGKIVLINLSGGNSVSRENMRLLGIMIVNEIFRCARLRDPHDPTHSSFHLYIDEFGQFITQEIAFALEECRKYRLFLTLAHQHLEQLKEDDPYLYASVLTNCKNRIVFGGLSYADADVMRQEISTGFLDLRRIKDEVWQTKQRSVEETRIVRGTSHAKARGESQSQTEGHSQSVSNTTTDGSSHSTSESQSVGHSEGKSESVGRSQNRSVKQNWGQSRTRTEGTSTSNTSGSSSTEGRGASHTNSSSMNSANYGNGTISHGTGQNTGANLTSSTATTSSSSSGKNQSQSEGHSESHGNAFGLTDSYTAGGTSTETISDQQGQTTGHSKSNASGRSEGKSQSTSHGVSNTETETVSESTVPFQRSEEYQELSGRTFWSLAELEHMATASIKNQDIGVAFVRFGTGEPQSVEIRRIPDTPRVPQKHARFLEANRISQATLYMDREEAEAVWQNRQISHFGRAIRFAGPAKGEHHHMQDTGADDLFE